MLYIILIVIAIILTFLTSHILSYKHINMDPGINIQQTEHPSPDVIYKMMSTRLPCIFMYEIELWDGYDLLIGYPYEAISTVLLDNKDLIKTLKKEYLTPFALPLSRDWSVNLIKQEQTWADLITKPIKEVHYNHLIGNFTGLMMVCLIHPKHEKLITDYLDTTNSSNDKLTSFTKYLETDNPDLEYLTVPIRPGHVLYIPYGWYYYIYCGQEKSYTLYMDLVNNTWFN